MKKLKICERCGKEYYSNKENGKYCSVECRYIRVLTNCSNCGKEVSVIESKLKYHKNHFCNSSCNKEFKAKNSKKGKPIKKVCINCGNDTWTSLYHESINKTGQFYCCRKCRGEYKAKEAGSKIVKWTCCEKEVYKRGYLIQSNEYNFCSVKCRIFFDKYIREHPKGSDSPLWTGGSDILSCVRGLSKNLDWRLSIYKRDNHVCKKCGNKGIEAHHIKPISVIVKEYSITSTEQALQCLELWDSNNGILLCKPCHKKEHSKDSNMFVKRKYVYKNNV